MPIDALAVLLLTAVVAATAFVLDGRNQKPAHGGNREQATRENQPTTK